MSLVLVHIVHHPTISNSKQLSTGYSAERETEPLIKACSRIVTVHEQDAMRRVLRHYEPHTLLLVSNVVIHKAVSQHAQMGTQ